nr:hypothetical protein [Bacillus thuringiensis]
MEYSLTEKGITLEPIIRRIENSHKNG